MINFFNRKKNLTLPNELEELRIFQQIYEVIVSELDLEKLAQNISDIAAKHLSTVALVLTLLTDDKKFLYAHTMSSGLAGKIVTTLTGNTFREKISTDKAYTLTIKAILENKIQFSEHVWDMTSPPASLKISKLAQRIYRMKGVVAVPIYLGDEPLGALICAFTKKVEDISENEIRLLKKYAGYIAFAISRSKTYEREKATVSLLTEQNRDLQSLNNLASQVSRSLDPFKVAQIAVDSLPQDDTMLGAILTEHDPIVNKLNIIALTQNNIAQKVTGVIGDIKKYEVDLNDPMYAQTLTYRSFMTQEPQFSDDLAVYLHPPVPEIFINPIQKIIGIKSVAVYPLKIREKTIGTIAYLIKNRAVSEIDDNQRRLLQTFTTQIAIALDNAQLFRKTEETQKSLEKALIDLQEVRRRERDMIDIMGHELRTPLSIARNALSMIDMELNHAKSISLDKVRKYSTIGLDAARREADLVETLLSATKVEGKGFQLTFEVIDLKHVIETSLIEFKRQAETKGLTLTLNLPEKDIKVYADKTRIQEISDNFIGNAIKYTPEGSVTISLIQKDNFGWISVKDTGFGIAKADLKNLGKKFFRAKQYTKHGDEAMGIIRPGGTGLGLFVSFALVKVMDGTYSVESELEEGSTFSFGLPIYTNQPIKQVERKIEDYLQNDEPEDVSAE